MELAGIHSFSPSRPVERVRAPVGASLEELTIGLPEAHPTSFPVLRDASGASRLVVTMAEGVVALPYVAGTSTEASSGYRAVPPRDARVGNDPVSAADFGTVLTRSAQSLTTNASQPCAVPVPPPPRGVSAKAEDLSANAPNRGTWNPSDDPVNALLSHMLSGFAMDRILEQLGGSWFEAPTDEDGRGEHTQHYLMQQVLSKLQPEALKAATALLKGDSAALADMQSEIAEFFLGPPSSASDPVLRVKLDLDPKGNAIASGAAKTFLGGGAEVVAREGDAVQLDGVAVQGGAPHVLVEGKPVGRAAKSTSGQGPLGPGSVTVLVGEEGGTPPPPPPEEVHQSRESTHAGRFNCTSIEQYTELPDVPEELKELLVDPETGNWKLFGGLVDLGSPEIPGAGMSNWTWIIPDRILGYDMSDYFLFHDLHFFEKDWGLGSLDEVLNVEWQAFLAGLKPDPIQIALQIVYSSATTLVGLVIATMNSFQAMAKDTSVDIHGSRP